MMSTFMRSASRGSTVPTCRSHDADSCRIGSTPLGTRDRSKPSGIAANTRDTRGLSHHALARPWNTYRPDGVRTDRASKRIRTRAVLLTGDDQEVLRQNDRAIRRSGFGCQIHSQHPAHHLPQRVAHGALDTVHDRRVLVALDRSKPGRQQKLPDGCAGESLLVRHVTISDAAEERRLRIHGVRDPSSVRPQHPADLVYQREELVPPKVFDYVKREHHVERLGGSRMDRFAEVSLRDAADA